MGKGSPNLTATLRACDDSTLKFRLYYYNGVFSTCAVSEVRIRPGIQW